MSTIAENLERIKNAKSAIKASVTNKGVNIPDGTTLDGYSTYIDAISGGGTATTIITDDNGDPIYIKAKSTVTNVNLANCSTLVELDLSDMPVETVRVGTYEDCNVNLDNCSNLVKVTWPTSMNNFSISHIGGCSKLYELPLTTDHVQLNGNNIIKELTIGSTNSYADLSYTSIMKITKGWEGDARYTAYIRGTYIPYIETEYFNFGEDETEDQTGLLGTVKNNYITRYPYVTEVESSQYSTDNFGNECWSLRKATINNTWDEGGSFDFGCILKNCYSLEEIYIPYAEGGVPTLNGESFRVNQNGTMIVPYDLIIYVPSDLLEAYKASDSWADFKDHFYAISE